MAAGAWKLFNESRKKIGNGTINLAGSFRMALVKTMPAATVSLLSELTQLTEQNGYSSSGKTVTGEAWTVSSGGAATYKFDTDDVVWTATGGNITSIKGAVMFVSAASAGGCHLLCYSTLTTAAFTLSSGNTLTIAQPATGVFTMV